MKFAVWTYTAAISFASLAVAMLGSLLGNFHHHRIGDMPLPRLTMFLLTYYRWALGVPLLWLVAAIWLSRRDAATTPRMFAFAAISTLALTFLFACTAVAFVLPFVTVVSIR